MEQLLIQRYNSIFTQRMLSKQGQWINQQVLEELSSKKQIIPKNIKILQAQLQWHFPALQVRRNYEKYLHIVTLQDCKKFHFSHRKKIDYKILDERVIYEILNKFDLGDI